MNSPVSDIFHFLSKTISIKPNQEKTLKSRKEKNKYIRKVRQMTQHINMNTIQYNTIHTSIMCVCYAIKLIKNNYWINNHNFLSNHLNHYLTVEFVYLIKGCVSVNEFLLSIFNLVLLH